MILDDQLNGWKQVKVSLQCCHGNKSIKNCHIVIKKATEDGNAMRKHAGCRTWIIILQDDQYVFLLAKRNRNVTPSQVDANLAIATSTHISARTILI